MDVKPDTRNVNFSDSIMLLLAKRPYKRLISQTHTPLRKLTTTKQTKAPHPYGTRGENIGSEYPYLFLLHPPNNCQSSNTGPQ